MSPMITRIRKTLIRPTAIIATVFSLSRFKANVAKMGAIMDASRIVLDTAMTANCSFGEHSFKIGPAHISAIQATIESERLQAASCALL